MSGDLTITALTSALDGLAARQRAIADNIANINTPGFLASKVDFESQLRAALADGSDPSTATPTYARSLEPTRLDGNNVNLDEETLSDVETGLQYQLMTTAVSNKFGLLRSAIGTS